MSPLFAFLRQRFPDNKVAPEHFGDLLSTYEASGLAPPHLVQEVTSGDEAKLWAHVWEAMLYRHLASLSIPLRKGGVRKSGQLGPDFGLRIEGRTVWIEAVVPSPEGIPLEWLEPAKVGETRVRSMPHEAMLLRWTSVLRDKRDKLQLYVDRGIIEANDYTVVAVNACRLSDFTFDDHGISQLPFAVEAVFPIGPLAVPITKDGRLDGDATRTVRPSIQKANRSHVPTGNFLDPAYAVVGALMGCHRRGMLNGALSLTLVHNPLAVNHLPRSLLGVEREYFASDHGDHYLLETM